MLYYIIADRRQKVNKKRKEDFSMNIKESKTMFVTINEAAALTGLARSYIRQGCKDGTIPCIRVGGRENATYKIHYEQFCQQLYNMAAKIS